MCCFGTLGRKATMLAVFIVEEMNSLERLCTPCRGICSNTLRPHIRLSGKDPEGRDWTSRAQAYPKPLAREYIGIMGQSLKTAFIKDNMKLLRPKPTPLIYVRMARTGSRLFFVAARQLNTHKRIGVDTLAAEASSVEACASEPRSCSFAVALNKLKKYVVVGAGVDTVGTMFVFRRLSSNCELRSLSFCVK